MKTYQKGFALPILILLIAALTIGGTVAAYKGGSLLREIQWNKKSDLITVDLESKQIEATTSASSPASTKQENEKDNKSPTVTNDQRSRFENEDENESEDEDDDNESRLGSQIQVNPATTVNVSNQATTTYSLSQVSTHNSPQNCWTTINGFVYNVTPWINQHPGGAQAIISLCGIDGSSAFNNQHGGQARPASELAAFKIGVLVK